MENQQSVVPFPQRRKAEIDTIVNLWLKNAMNSSQSIRTHDTYKMTIETFRFKLHSLGMDLDGLPLSHPAIDKDREQSLILLSTAAQGFASFSVRGKNLSASTYNQRLSILSSFYIFARKRRLLLMDNPIDLLDRRDVQEYKHAQPISKEQVERVLKAIDRSVLAGKRDYALLLILFSTGRRAHEVLSLQLKHIEPIENTAILHFEHCKGGKGMYDMLDPRVWQALYDYLHTAQLSNMATKSPEQFVWISLSMKHIKHPLTQRGLADIFNKHFKTMNIHTTRHTFAHGMDKAGASITDIQNRLGHSSPSTTGRYLQRLKSAENKYASSLLDFWGIEE